MLRPYIYTAVDAVVPLHLITHRNPKIWKLRMLLSKLYYPGEIKAVACLMETPRKNWILWTKFPNACPRRSFPCVKVLWCSVWQKNICRHLSLVVWPFDYQPLHILWNNMNQAVRKCHFWLETTNLLWTSIDFVHQVSGDGRSLKVFPLHWLS